MSEVAIDYGSRRHTKVHGRVEDSPEAYLVGVDEPVTVTRFEQSRAVTNDRSSRSFFERVIADYLSSAVLSRLLSASPSATDRAQDIVDFLAIQAAEIASLEAIYVSLRDGVYNCVIVVNNSTTEDRFALYDIEWQVAKVFTKERLYFEVIDREDAPIDELGISEPDSLFERSSGNA